MNLLCMDLKGSDKVYSAKKTSLRKIRVTKQCYMGQGIIELWMRKLTSRKINLIGKFLHYHLIRNSFEILVLNLYIM